MKRALVVGASDGIGRATAEALLADGWRVSGISRSPSALLHERYTHVACDVTTAEYREVLRERSVEPFDAVIYCAGIGEPWVLGEVDEEVRVLEVNLVAAVATAAVLLPPMVAAKRGSFVVISSLGDELISREYPSYNASKAGVSSYFAGLGEALRGAGVTVSHIRFGFVDTKMAKAAFRPFMVSRAAAARVVLRVIEKRQRRASFPLRMAWLVGVLGFFQRAKRCFG